MVYKVTRATLFENPFKDYKGDLYIRFLKDELVCSRENANIRKYASVLIKEGYPIEKMTCDCGKHERKHYGYYYEWAKEYRP